MLCHQWIRRGRFLDTVRNNAKSFASTPITYRKLLNTKSSSLMRQITRPQTFNSVLRASIEEFSTTADSSSPATTKQNHWPLHSRCAVIDFTIKGNKSAVGRILLQAFTKHLGCGEHRVWSKSRCRTGLKALSRLRRVLNECQRYSTGGKIDAGILASFSDISVNDLLKFLKEKNFTEVRKWVVSNWIMILPSFFGEFMMHFMMH